MINTQRFTFSRVAIYATLIMKAAARMWSAITRSDLFSRSVAPW